MFFLIAIFIFGLIIGSFLNCVIYRLRIKDTLGGRSYCPLCKHNLQFLDLVPVISFLILGGKCHYCKKKISWQYPVVEIITALIFVLILNHQLSIFNEVSIINYQFIISALFLFYIFSCLVVIFVYDLKHYLIPDKVLLPAIAITFIYQLLFNFSFLIFNSLWAALGAFLFFFLIFFVSDGKSMGFGDVKLTVLLGLLLGFPNIALAIFLACIFGSIIGGGAVLLGRKKIKSMIPFAPFLIAGAFIAFFWGQEIIDWYYLLIVVS